MEVIRYLRPDTLLREKCHYNNHMFSLVGHLISLVSGQTYASFVEERILQPLQMSTTTFGSASLKMGITPYHLRDGEAHELGWWHGECGDNTTLAPAGGILSNAVDMSKWLQYLISSSNGDLDRPIKILEKETLLTILRSHALVDWQIAFDNQIGQSAYLEFSPPTYGIGLQRFHYR